MAVQPLLDTRGLRRHRAAMRNIPALTGLRFFAAAAIVLTHSQGRYFQQGTFNPFFLDGAVPLFFVLSGFVLTINADNYRSWPDFLAARISRIWPAHLAAIAFWAVIFLPYSIPSVLAPHMGLRLVQNIFLLQSWSPDRATYWSFNAPSWSVSSELFLYAVFPLCLATGLRGGAVIGSAVVVLILLLGRAFPHVDANWLSVINPVAALPVFIAGIVAGIWARRLPVQKNSGVQIAALALALAANAACHKLPSAFFSVSGPAPFYALLIFALARYDGVVSRFLSHRALVYGGEISYSVYLFHQLIIRWDAGHDFAVPMWARYAAVLTAAGVIAAASHRFVEVPGRNMLHGLWRQKSRLIGSSEKSGGDHRGHSVFRLLRRHVDSRVARRLAKP